MEFSSVTPDQAQDGQPRSRHGPPASFLSGQVGGSLVSVGLFSKTADHFVFQVNHNYH